MNRRAFTLLEVMLSSLLASFILIGCFGLFTMIDRTERALAGRYEDVQQFARCQATLRRAMQSLVAAFPTSPQPVATTSRAVTPAGENENITEADELSDTDGEGEEESETRGPPYFAVKPLLMEDQQSDADVGDVPWRLELVLSASPVTLAQQHDGPIRGAFDIVDVYNPATDESEWALLWTPLNPPGEPVVLVEGLRLALMAVLPRDSSEFTGRYAARELKDFPRAIRFILWTRGGAKTDWVFEPGMIEGAAP